MTNHQSSLRQIQHHLAECRSLREDWRGHENQFDPESHLAFWSALTHYTYVALQAKRTEIEKAREKVANIKRDADDPAFAELDAEIAEALCAANDKLAQLQAVQS